MHFREPVNGFLHFGALVLSIVGTVILAWACRGDLVRLGTAIVYGVGMCGCFLFSTLHHLIRAEQITENRLLKLDHAAIFPFIAGTYTPICVHLLPSSGKILLVVVWAIALGGVVYKLFFSKGQLRVEDPPDLPSTLVYIGMGWLIVSQFPYLVMRCQGIWLPALGGLLYTVGGLILARRWFDFWPGRFGHHEIWHICVIGGAACLYAFLFLNLG